MLEYRRSCESCGRELANDDQQVYICSFECTWCADCAVTFPRSTCPNCGGILALRPCRPVYPGGTPKAPVRLHSDCRSCLPSGAA